MYRKVANNRSLMDRTYFFRKHESGCQGQVFPKQSDYSKQLMDDPAKS